jgi:hypothetical protein
MLDLNSETLNQSKKWDISKVSRNHLNGFWGFFLKPWYQVTNMGAGLVHPRSSQT